MNFLHVTQLHAIKFSTCRQSLDQLVCHGALQLVKENAAINV
jgi:hypothetical protein